MTTKKTYYCNFCRKEIRDAAGVGLYWEGDAMIERLLMDVENHLCDKCVLALGDFLRSGLCKVSRERLRDNAEVEG